MTVLENRVSYKQAAMPDEMSSVIMEAGSLCQISAQGKKQVQKKKAYSSPCVFVDFLPVLATGQNPMAGVL